MDAQTDTASLAAGHNPYMFDSDHFEKLLTEHSERLFVGDHELQIKIVEVGHRGTRVRMLHQAEDDRGCRKADYICQIGSSRHLQPLRATCSRTTSKGLASCKLDSDSPKKALASQSADGVTSLIPQPYSWDRLTISEKALRALVHHFKIFPAFVDVLCAFGKLTSESSDSLGGCFQWKQGNASGTSPLRLELSTIRKETALTSTSKRDMLSRQKRREARPTRLRGAMVNPPVRGVPSP